MMNEKLTGTITALITPFNDDLSIDFEAFEKIVEFQIAEGIDALVICGSTGESATLSAKEKLSLFIRAGEISGGRVPIIAGTGSNNTRDSIDLSLLAKEHGADATLLVAPYYNKPTQEGLYHHYMAIAEAVELPHIIYNVPGRSGINISTETQLKLARDSKNFVAVKEASGDLEQMANIINGAPDGFHLLIGDDSLSLPGYAIGSRGVVSVISNYAPKMFGDLNRAAAAGDYSKAREIHFKLLELMKLNFVESNPTPVKTALAMMGLCKENFRLPLVPMTLPNKGKLETALLKVGLLN